MRMFVLHLVLELRQLICCHLNHHPYENCHPKPSKRRISTRLSSSRFRLFICRRNKLKANLDNTPGNLSVICKLSASDFYSHWIPQTIIFISLLTNKNHKHENILFLGLWILAKINLARQCFS